MIYLGCIPVKDLSPKVGTLEEEIAVQLCWYYTEGECLPV